MVMAQHDQWQTARISRLERISRAEINTQRDLEEIMERLDSCAGLGDETEKKEIAKRRKRKFLNIAVPHGIITCLCVTFCIVFLVQQGKHIEYGGQMKDYLVREGQLDGVMSTIHVEFGALTLSLCEDGRGGDLSQIYDITDKKIEHFLPDKNLVKWTILNLLRDYRSSDPGSGSFYVKLVKHAKFYRKVVHNLRYTVQNEELGFEERDGWKLAYDFQLKTRQYFNVRMLMSTLRALDGCLLTNTENHELFTTLEMLVTDLCSLLGGLRNERVYLSLSYTVLNVLHQYILDQLNLTSPLFVSLYRNNVSLTRNVSGMVETEVFNSSSTDGNRTTSNVVDQNDEDNITDTDDLDQDGVVISDNEIPDEVTTNPIQNDNQTTANEEHDQNNSSLHFTGTAVTKEFGQISNGPKSITDLHGLFEDLEHEIRNGIQDNLKSQTERNLSTTNYAVLCFSALLLILFLVLALTALFVSILRTESELVIGVGDWLKHLTNDLNTKRDELYDIGKKIIPQPLLMEVDFHSTDFTSVPYFCEKATFLMFSISRFMSYFSLFTSAQTIHILTLVMELVDERIEQYDVISVTCMGERQVVFSDKSYSQRAQHASEIANLALDIMSCCSDLEIGRQSPHSKLHITIGIHTGPCVGMLYKRNGLIKYVVTGHTLSVLHKVHKTAVPNRVQITEPTFKLLDPLDTYSLYIRGNINVKDFSVFKVYWLNGRRISTGTSDCESMRSRIGSWFEIERKPLYRLDEIEGIYEPIDKPKSLLYT